jgi:hypothetical protein
MGLSGGRPRHSPAVLTRGDAPPSFSHSLNDPDVRNGAVRGKPHGALVGVSSVVELGEQASPRDDEKMMIICGRAGVVWGTCVDGGAFGSGTGSRPR